MFTRNYRPSLIKKVVYFFVTFLFFSREICIWNLALICFLLSWSSFDISAFPHCLKMTTNIFFIPIWLNYQITIPLKDSWTTLQIRSRNKIDSPFHDTCQSTLENARCNLIWSINPLALIKIREEIRDKLFRVRTWQSDSRVLERFPLRLKPC